MLMVVVFRTMYRDIGKAAHCHITIPLPFCSLYFFNVITFIASFLRGATQGNMTSQRERTVPEITHAQPWLPSPTADPYSHDCYMNTSYSMHNTQSRLPVNDNDVITSIATIGTFEAVVFFFLVQCHHMSFVDFVVLPPGHGRSVTDF